MRHVGTHLAGDGLGDNVAFLWNAWWMRHVLASGQDGFFFTSFLFAPYGVDLVQHTHTALMSLVGATLLAPLPLVASLNILILVALFLNALAAYGLAFEQTGHRGGSVVAAIVFGGSPYVMAHLHGHVNLLSAWGLPVFALFLSRAIRLESMWWSAAAGAALVAVAYSDYYYGVYAGVLGLIYGVAACLTWSVRLGAGGPSSPWPRRTVVALLAADIVLVAAIALTGGGVIAAGPARISVLEVRNPVTIGWFLLLATAWLTWRPQLRAAAVPGASGRTLRLAVPLLALVLVGTAPLWLGGVRLWQSGDYATQITVWRSAPRGVDLLSLVAGNPFHPLWGSSVAGLYERFGLNRIEGVAWLGVVPLVLAALALRRWHSLGRETRRMALVGAAFLLWALGPSISCLGTNTGLMLPATLLRFVPVVANARMPGRAMVVVYLAVAMLAARWIAESDRRRTGWLRTLALAGLVCVDFCAAPFPLTELQAPRLYSALRDLPAGTVCELPLGIRDGFSEIGQLDHRVLYFQTIHAHPLAGGFVARLSPRVRQAYETNPVLGPLLRLSRGEPIARVEIGLDARAQALEELTRLGIRYVVLNRDTARPDLVQYAEQVLPLTLAIKEGSRELYLVGPPAT